MHHWVECMLTLRNGWAMEQIYQIHKWFHKKSNQNNNESFFCETQIQNPPKYTFDQIWSNLIKMYVLIKFVFFHNIQNWMEKMGLKWILGFLDQRGLSEQCLQFFAIMISMQRNPKKPKKNIQWPQKHSWQHGLIHLLSRQILPHPNLTLLPHPQSTNHVLAGNVQCQVQWSLLSRDHCCKKNPSTSKVKRREPISTTPFCQGRVNFCTTLFGQKCEVVCTKGLLKQCLNSGVLLYLNRNLNWFQWLD